ncbi:outer membrane beta-barrel family protein [uncultured Croceitalea sp.]|uniref:outer membrane beta-barrel family protein n=1 Tax=uncultured Croceitalea sp. TaxID=1798908 RepID=UPI003305A267
MVRFCLILFLFCMCGTSFSQQVKVFGGVVKDAQTGANIPFATVALLNGQDLLDGTSTDENGSFTLRSNQKITHIEISFIGYETYLLPFDDIRSPNEILVRLLASNVELNEVVVAAEQTTTTLKIDRKVVNLGADLQQAGATVLEAFDQISEIQTDLGTGTLSLRGSGNVRLLVNGKPSGLSAGELLAQLPASSVQKVEIITSPSAKNQADGLSGIVNIILKKNRARGLNLNLNSGAGTKRYNYGVDGNYNYSWVNFRWNASQARREMDSEQTIAQRYTNGDTRDFYAPHDFNGLVRKITMGLDFFINDNNELSFGFDYTNDYHSFFNDTFYSNVTNSDDFVYTRNSAHTHKTTEINGNYRKKFAKEGHFIEFDYNVGLNENLLPAIDFEDAVFLFEEEQRNKNTLQQFAFDHALPLNTKTTVESGLLWNNRKLESFDFFQPAGNLAQNETFDYREQILGVYTMGTLQIGGFNTQAGLRYEHFTSNSTNTLNNQSTDLVFKDLFPSLHFSYVVNETNTISIGYSKRVSRPNFRHVNPFQMGNQYFEWVANPSLKPEFSDNFEFNVQHNGKAMTWSFSTFYRDRTDVIVWLQEIDGQGVQTISFDNLGRKQSYGVEADIRHRIKPFWNTQLSANYYYTKVDQQALITFDDLYSSNIIFKNTFKIAKNISTDITYRHTPKNQNEFRFIQPRNRLDWAVRAKFLENRLTANLRIIDVLDNNLREGTLITEQVTQNEIWRFQSQTFGVLFSLNYGLFQNQGKTRNRKQRDYGHDGATD